MPDDQAPGTQTTASTPAVEPTTTAAPAAVSTPAAAKTTTGTAVADDDPIMGAAQAAGSLAPWKKGARWEVVVAQGIILGIAGLVIWLAPGFGASAALQLIALLLLAMALLSTWRIMRGEGFKP